jgi:hypothetical protein
MQDGRHSAQVLSGEVADSLTMRSSRFSPKPLNGDVAVGDSQIDFVGLFDFVGRVGLEPTTQGL